MFYLVDKIAPMAYEQWTRDIPIEGKRGNIYDKEIYFICKFFPGVYIYCNFLI